MEFSNELKGTLTETAVLCLLRHAGYPIVATGIESLLPVLPLLSGGRIAQLEMGPELRHFPDALVLPHGGAALQIEVKYRRRIDRESLCHLIDKLAEQQKTFPETHTILVRSISPRGETARADDLIRVLPPHRLELLAAGDLFFHSAAGEGAPEDLRLEPLWSALRPMSSAFDALRGPQRGHLERLVPLILALADV